MKKPALTKSKKKNRLVMLLYNLLDHRLCWYQVLQRNDAQQQKDFSSPCQQEC
jgi:hypothetical protein